MTTEPTPEPTTTLGLVVERGDPITVSTFDDPCIGTTTQYGLVPCSIPSASPALPATGAASCGIVVAATAAVLLGKLLHSTSHRKG